ncbi:MAG: zinc ribbon domain-containing protein, partial [Candidatus Obscuribacterales bacterium]|nr:zinc ribbon domain-containing protein [Candidatus Obscuribacterales bacterium]
QQEAQQMAEQQAAMRAQQEAQQMAEEQAAMRAQQEAQQMAEEQAALQAQQEARPATIPAQQPEHQVLSQAQYEALISQKQFSPNGAETGSPVGSQSEDQAEAALKAKQEALHRVQEKAAQRAMIDLELRMQQEVAIRTGETAPVAQSAVDPNDDINRLVNEQFDFGARSTPPPQEPSTPAVEKEADPERVKDERVVRSNKEILEDMSPAEREKQQDVLRKKAREKLVAKGRKKKGGAADAEPPQEVAPAAVESPTPAVEDVRVESQKAPPVVAAPEESRPHFVIPGPEPAESPQVDTGPLPPVVPPYDAMGRPVEEPIGRNDDIQPVPVSQDMFEQGADAAGRGLPSVTGQSPPQQVMSPFGQAGDMPGASLSPSASGITIHNLQRGLNPELPELNFLAPEKSTPPPLVIEETVAAPLPVEPQQPSYAPLQVPNLPLSQDVQPPNPQMYAPLPPHPQPDSAYTPQQEYTTVLPQAAPQQEIAPALPQPVAPQPIAPQPIPSSTLPQCPGCALPLEPNARFCGECGYQLQVRIQACPSCQLPLEPSAKFCGECGYSLQ